jgi:hypothetical protein
MTYPDCTTYAGYDIDAYLLALFFLAVFLGPFCCCCMAKCTNRGDGLPRVSSDATLPTTKKDVGGNDDADRTPVEYFCGDEFFCHLKKSPTNNLGGAIAVRLAMAVVAAFLLTWVLLAIIFAGAQQSLMYPAESATACTPCTGNLATITFEDYESAAPDRSPYCCDFNPAGYLDVRA